MYPAALAASAARFRDENLQEERVWSCNELTEAVEKALGVKVGREATRLRILQMGYCWKRTRYAPCKQIDPEVEGELGDAEKGAQDTCLTLYYLDELGFSLALPVTYTWSRRGNNHWC